MPEHKMYLSSTLVNSEKTVDVQHKEQTHKESVENPIYAGRGNFNKNYVKAKRETTLMPGVYTNY